FTVTYDTPTSISLLGAAELTTASGPDSAFSKLETLGITASGKAWFYVNTTAADETVTLTLTDGTTKDVVVQGESGGMGVDGRLSWQLGGAAWFALVGVVDLKVSSASGAELFVAAELQVGPGGSILSLDAAGALIANEDGLFGMVQLTTSA